MSQILGIRLFSVGMLALATYLLWIPSERSLQTKQGHVIAAHDYVGGRKTATLAFEDGSTASCYARSVSAWACPIDRLQTLADTQDKVIAKVRNNKIYDIETANGVKLLDYSKVRRYGLILLLFIDAVFVGIGIFAPQRIRPRY